MATTRTSLVLAGFLILTSCLNAGCGGDSPTANEPPARPAVPSGFTAAPGAGTVTLAWQAVAEATGYTVFWDLDGTVDADDASSDVAAPPFVHAGLTNGTTYFYRVAARNDAGLGDLSGQVAATPNQLLGIRFIACGDRSSFLVDGQGTLHAWGENGDGQLGIGSWTDALAPVTVPVVSDVVAVSAGLYHTLVLTGSGRVYSMGDNSYGSLGTGDQQPRWYPELITSPTNFVAVAAGRQHSMGVTADGDVYVWGTNIGGHLGLGYESGAVMTPTLALASFWGTPGQVAAGDLTSFFKPDSDGTHSSGLYSWGTIGGDVLGRDTGGSLDIGNTPAVIAGTSAVTAFAAGYRHSLALREDGSVLSWGVNAEGQLGRFTSGTSGLPDAVELVQHATAVAVGDFHSLALGADGRVMSWGGNGAGQLGDGTRTDSPVRTWVSDLTDVVLIAAGGNRNLALKRDGTLWAWGSGPLGDGTVSSRDTPVQITGF